MLQARICARPGQVVSRRLASTRSLRSFSTVKEVLKKPTTAKDDATFLSTFIKKSCYFLIVNAAAKLMKPRAELLNLFQAAGILTLALRISLNNSNHQKEKCASLVAPHCQHHTNLIGRERLEREIADLRDELDRVGGTPADSGRGK